MSVAVAHHTRSSSALALTEGARQAAYRGTDLVVIHVVESLDNDIAEANKAGISDAVESALAADLPARPASGTCASSPAGSDIADVSEAILATVRRARSGPARHRGPAPLADGQGLPRQRGAEHHPRRGRARPRRQESEVMTRGCADMNTSRMAESVSLVCGHAQAR